MVLNHSQNASTLPRILIVDVHEQNVELLEAYLEEVRATVTSASDGLAALKQIESQVPDLILLDVMMPKMSGFQVAQKLRASAATREIPIIMVTALGEVSDMQRAEDLGITDYLTKPVNKVDLLNRVRAVLKQ